MTLITRIMQITDLDEIIAFEKELLAKSNDDEMDREIQSWNARWRSESLAHHLPMGWSFSARNDNGKLLGYFIAQPLLFFDGQTQSLWVEHFQTIDDTTAHDLFELAYRLAREKHFQKVYLPANLLLSPNINKLAQAWKSLPWAPETIFLKTTKG